MMRLKNVWRKWCGIALSSLLILGGCDRFPPKPHANSLGMTFALIPAGTFTMGADKNFEAANADETPLRKVTISQPFYLGRYEVTQEQWVAVMGDNPSAFKGRNHPVEQVSWNEVQEFIQRLNQKEGHTRYRLPTEAEWEYAARAGTTTAYSFGDDARQLGDYAWYNNNSDGGTHPVGQKEPNAWGLYDIHGNVWEWTQDWYSEDSYNKSADKSITRRYIDPSGVASGVERVNRGGGWGVIAALCRAASRGSTSPDDRGSALGFRLAISVE